MAARRSLRRAGVALGLFVTAPAVAGDVPGGAATAVPPIIAGILVTAERRVDAAQQVPMALTVSSGDRLHAIGATTSLGIGDFVPNMIASNAIGLGSANIIALRGLGNAATDTLTSPAVATFIDDVYFGRPNGSNFGLFEVGRVEVLRGAQGTLWGRNTSGGAINVVLDRPADTIGGAAEFGVGGFGRKRLRGSIDLPFSPAVQVKLSGFIQNDSGYVHNTTTGERLNDSDMAGLRGAVQLKLTDTLRWNLAATYMRNDGENLPNLLCDPNAPAACSARYSGTDARREPNASLPGTSAQAIALGNRLDTQLYSSHIDWVGANFALSAITGFIGSMERSALDLAPGASPTANDPSPKPINTRGAGSLPVTTNGTSDQFSQELKFAASLLAGRVDLVTGLLYTDENNVTDTGRAVIRSGTRDKAAYLQVDVNATSRLKLAAGVRYTDEQTRFGITDNRNVPSQTCPAFPAQCLDTANLVTGPTRTSKIWTPRFAASYRAGDAVLVYASAARGWRSGGWDARSTNVRRILPFEPETAWTYEGGIKADMLGGRLRANLAGFWIEATNVQVPLLAGASSLQSEAVVQNIAGYRNRGVEIELTAVPVTGLNLTASFGYQKDRYEVDDSLAPNAFGVKSVARQQADCRVQLAQRQVPLAVGGTLIRVPGLGPGNQDVVVFPTGTTDCATGIVDANGNIAEPVRTPDFSVMLGGSYDWPIPAAGIVLTPSASALYRTGFEAGAGNATLFTGSVNGPGTVVLPANPFAGDVITGSRNPATWLVTAALTLRTDDNNWTLSVECSNCLDVAYTQSVVGTVSYRNPPRLWQIRARRVF